MAIPFLPEGSDCIRFETSLEDNGVTILDLDETMNEYIESLPENIRYIKNFEIKMYYSDTDDSRIMDIGFIKGNYIEPELFYGQEVDFLSLCDMESGELYDLSKAITTKDGSVKNTLCDFDCGIIYIDKIFINEGNRNLGFGKYLMNNFNDILGHSANFKGQVIFLKPFPLVKNQNGGIDDKEQGELFNADTKRLIKLYKQLGYEKIRNTDYMVKKLFNKI